MKTRAAGVSSLVSQPHLSEWICTCTSLASFPVVSLECRVPHLLPKANSSPSPSWGPHQSSPTHFSIFLSTGSFPHTNMAKSLLSSGETKTRCSLWLLSPASAHSVKLRDGSCLLPSHSSAPCFWVQPPQSRSHRGQSSNPEVFMLPALLQPFATEEQSLLSMASRATFFPDFSLSCLAPLAQASSLSYGPSPAL